MTNISFLRLANSISVSSNSKQAVKNAAPKSTPPVDAAKKIKDEFVPSSTKATITQEMLDADMNKKAKAEDKVFESLGINYGDWTGCSIGADEHGQVQADLTVIEFREGFNAPDMKTIIDAFNKTYIDGKPYGKFQIESEQRRETYWQQREAEEAKTNPANKPITFSMPMFYKGGLKPINTSTPAAKMIKGMTETFLEGVISRVLKAEGIELKDGDRIAMKINGKGEFTINANASSFKGKSEKEIEDICQSLEKSLNETKDEESNSLGRAILTHFAEEGGYKLSEIADDEDFSLSFSFEYNGKKKSNEMTSIHIIKKQVEMLKKEKVEWAERVVATEPVQEEAEQEEQTEEVMSDEPSLLQSKIEEDSKS